MRHRLTERQIEQFHEEGYLRGLRVLDDAAVAALRRKYLEFTERLRAKGLTHNDVNGWWAVNSYFFGVCQTCAVLDYVECLLGPNLMIWGGQFFAKDPHDGTTVPWHQDAPYWPLAPIDRVVSVWLALWDVDTGNAAMQVVPGSHRQLLPHRGERRDSDVLGHVATVEALGPDEVVDLVLAAGEMSLHSPGLLHGSTANQSERMRCGMTMRIASTEVKADLVREPNFRWIALRGRDEYRHNPTQSPPTEEGIPTGYNQYGAVSGSG